MRSLRLIGVLIAGASVALALLPVCAVFSAGGATAQGGLSCTGEDQEQWSGTQTSAETVEVSGDVHDVPCPVPQVNHAAGDTSYTVASPSGSAPVNGTPCKEGIWSDVWMGDLRDGNWQVQYYDPNLGRVVSVAVSDEPSPFLPISYGQLTSSAWTLNSLPWQMGSLSDAILWVMQGTYEGGKCVANSDGWTDFDGTHQCDPSGALFPAECVVFGTPRGTLTYTPPATSTFTPYLAGIIANMEATYQTGSVTTSWANGGQAVVSPGVGQAIVRYPVCFADTGGNLGTSHDWEILIPQTNTGPALVVDYVVSASVDETWWDFGDGASDEVPSTAPQAACSVEHTYYHVSADAYGSGEDHTNPPGETWTLGSEPQPNMEAVEAWYHVAVTVTAYYREPDGSTVEQSIPVPPGTDFWLADTPEWETVGQIESIPCQCTASPSAGG